MAWVYAQKTRLRQLARRAGTLDTEPMAIMALVAISGHYWNLLMAEEKAGAVFIHGELSLGNTLNLLGIYQALRGLRVLGQWVQTEFSSSIHRCLLGIELGSPA